MRITRMNTDDPDQAQDSSRRVIIEKDISHVIVGCFFDVYNELGYGFMELLYARALEITMQQRGLRVDREYPVAVSFRGQQIGFHRIDILVERRVVVEIKSTERLAESSRRQLRNYVKALGVGLGILLHFGPAPKFYRELRRGLHAPRST
jgi:GxxExxY protein